MPKAKDAPPEVVRENYYRHDELDSNPAARRSFQDNVPDIDDTQQRVVAELNAEGYSMISVADLFSQETWEQLKADADIYTRHIEAAVAEGAATPKPAKPGKPGKPEKERREKAFLGRRSKFEPITLDSPWMQTAASNRMLDIVNTYLGLWTKLTYVDQWYSPPRGSEADRLGSMRWHRDYNDQHLVKVFIYLVDVDAGTGPFEYVPGSVREGQFAGDWAWEPVGESYPPDEEFGRRIPASAVKTFTAPAGTIIFCNTSGFHRGGFATEKPRDIWVYNYVSPAALESLVDRNFDVSDSVDGLSEVQRFALT